MGMFNKKGKQPKERNAINDRDIKMQLANSALSLLEKGTDFEELANTQCTFGYLFEIEGHGLEALYKLVTDKTTAYFAAQGDNLMRLNFNEELFQNTVDGFMELHGDK